MPKITKEELIEELKKKGLKLESPYENYKNIYTDLKFRCKNGHLIYTNLKVVRSSNFKCTKCIGDYTESSEISLNNVPEKRGYRIVSFDNASQKMGVSIFDDGHLVFYKLYSFSGTATSRLFKIRNFLEKEVFPLWEPDFVQIEDVHLQPNKYKMFQTLTKLIVVFELACHSFNIPMDRVKPSAWRSHFGINRKDRQVEKDLAIKTVKNIYDIVVSDDIAEAILIGRYRSDLQKRNEIEDLF